MSIDAGIIAAMVSMCGTVLGAIISARVALKVSNEQHDKTVALIDYRLGELEEKVDKHNNVIERLYKVEAKVDSLAK